MLNECPRHFLSTAWEEIMLSLQKATRVEEQASGRPSSTPSFGISHAGDQDRVPLPPSLCIYAVLSPLKMGMAIAFFFLEYLGLDLPPQNEGTETKLLPVKFSLSDHRGLAGPVGSLHRYRR